MAQAREKPVLKSAKTTRGVDGVVCLNYFYHFKTQNADSTMRYFCRKPNCKAAITTTENSNELLKINSESYDSDEQIIDSHNGHPSIKPVEKLKKIFQEQYTKRCENQKDVPIYKIYQEEEILFTDAIEVMKKQIMEQSWIVLKIIYHHLIHCVVAFTVLEKDMKYKKDKNPKILKVNHEITLC